MRQSYTLQEVKLEVRGEDVQRALVEPEREGEPSMRSSDLQLMESAMNADRVRSVLRRLPQYAPRTDLSDSEIMDITLALVSGSACPVPMHNFTQFKEENAHAPGAMLPSSGPLRLCHPQSCLLPLLQAGTAFHKCVT